MPKTVFSIDMSSRVIRSPGGTWPIKHHQAVHFIAGLATNAPNYLTRAAFLVHWDKSSETSEPDRTAMSRVVNAVQDALARAGSASRVGLLPRKATVGPWWFDICPNEEWQVVNARSATSTSKPNNSSEGLGLTLSHTPASMLLAISVIAVADELARRAQYVEAVEHLAEQVRALDLSAEAQALLALRRARWLRRTGSTHHAGLALQEAQILAPAAHVEARASLLAECAMLRARLQYDADPLASPKVINFGQLTEQVEKAGSPQFRWELSNLQAMATRRSMETMLRDDSTARASQLMRLAEKANQAFNIAFYWLLTGSDPYHLQAVLVNYAHHLEWLRAQHCGAIASTDVADIVSAWRLSQLVTEKFDLTEDSAWDYIMLADFWLGSHSARVLIAADWRLWPQSRAPGMTDFYLHAVEVARRTGDARQQIFVWDRSAEFYKRTGRLREAEHALHNRDALFDCHAGLAKRLTHESFYAPLPDQKSSMAVNSMNTL